MLLAAVVRETLEVIEHGSYTLRPRRVRGLRSQPLATLRAFGARFA
jgi:hypothetical protein